MDGYNLIQDSTSLGFPLDTKYLVAVDKNADVGIGQQLGKHDGATETLTLLPGSPAIDKIPLCCPPPVFVNGITTDQRGMTRPDKNESACDIGAYESSY